MSKSDLLHRELGANIDESMGGRRVAPAASVAPRPLPARLLGVQRVNNVAEIAVDRIVPDPRQAREDFDADALNRLAESLKGKGQLQPIRVRWEEGQGAYVILVGERRWRAARLAGLKSMACVMVDGPVSDADRLSTQLVENALREDLKPVEQAKAYRALMEANGWSGSRLAKELAIAQASVAKALAILELPATVLSQVDQGEIGASVAYEISKLPDPESQGKVARAAVAQRLTRSEVADVVQAVRARRPEPASRPEPVLIDLGDGNAVKVTWRKANGVSALQALKKAVRVLQEQEKAG